MPRFLVLFVALLVAATHGLAAPAQDARSVLDGVSNVQWQVTPSQAMADPNEKTTVVWVGRVLDLVPSQGEGGETILDFYCSFMPLANQSPEGLAQPIATRPETNQIFLVSIRSPAFPIEQAKKLRLELKEKTHFVVVAGWPFQVARYGDHPVVQIGAYKAIFSDKLVFTTVPSAAQPGGQPGPAAKSAAGRLP